MYGNINFNSVFKQAARINCQKQKNYLNLLFLRSRSLAPIINRKSCDQKLQKL